MSALPYPLPWAVESSIRRDYVYIKGADGYPLALMQGALEDRLASAKKIVLAVNDREELEKEIKFLKAALHNAGTALDNMGNTSAAENAYRLAETPCIPPKDYRAMPIFPSQGCGTQG